MESPILVLEDGINLRDVVTSGSILHINQDYNELDSKEDSVALDIVHADFIGKPVCDFSLLEKYLVPIDENGFVKKKIMVEGGGLPLTDACTVSIAFSAYWEKEPVPFDIKTINRPMETDLKDHGLLPGLEIAVKSMLVGETSVFLLSYNVMYGKLGIPPRIKPKSDCVFFIKLIKSILTPKEGKIIYSEPNMFHRVQNEVKMLYSSGIVLYKSNNFTGAIQLFNKAVNMLHKCRLADENEEKSQEKLLVKLYINLAVCYNKVKNPYKVCIACNELNRLRSMWNNGKVLFQNAKALRTMGEYTQAEKRLKRAMHLCPDNNEMKAEHELLIKVRENSKRAKTFVQNVVGTNSNVISEDFKLEVDNVIRNFKNKKEENQFIFPGDLNVDEIEYLKQVCIQENLFFNTTDRNKLPERHPADLKTVSTNGLLEVEDYVLQKPEQKSYTQQSQEVLALVDEMDNNLNID